MGQSRHLPLRISDPFRAWQASKREADADNTQGRSCGIWVLALMSLSALLPHLTLIFLLSVPAALLQVKFAPRSGNSHWGAPVVLKNNR